MDRGWSDSEFSEPKEIEQIRFRVIALQGHGRAIQYICICSQPFFRSKYFEVMF